MFVIMKESFYPTFVAPFFSAKVGKTMLIPFLGFCFAVLFLIESSLSPTFCAVLLCFPKYMNFLLLWPLVDNNDNNSNDSDDSDDNDDDNNNNILDKKICTIDNDKIMILHNYICEVPVNYVYNVQFAT